MEDKEKRLDHIPFDMLEALNIMNTLSSNGMFSSIFGGSHNTDTVSKYPYQRLNNGYELRPIPLTKKESENSRIVEMKYSHLYHNELKVSDLIFRKGGFGGTFKDGYCSLINYTRTKQPKKNDSGFSFGTHVLINELGDIVLSRDGISDYPYHIGGHLGSIGNYLYDLRTGVAIAPKSSSTITCKSCIIIEHRYDWYDKEVKLPLGIYKIDFETAQITKIDEVK